MDDEYVAAGATSGATGSAYKDQLSGATVALSVIRVTNVTGITSEVYNQGIDYTLVSGNVLDWTNAPALPTPELETITHAAATGGSWSSGATEQSVSFVVTVKDQNADGETSSSNTLTFTISSATQKVTVQWARVPFAGGYNVYLNATGGTKFYATVAGSGTTTLTVTGDSGTLTGAPATNTTKRRPATAQAYYVDYYYPTFTYQQQEFTNYSDFESVHGIGSNLSRAAKLAFDNGASSIIAVAVSGETAGHYQNAIDQLKTSEVQYVVALKSGTAVEQYLRNHAEYCSQDTVGKERDAVVAAASGSSKADAVTWASTFGGTKRIIAVITNNADYFVNVWQTTGGTYLDGPYEVPHYFFAAAIAGRLCGLYDSATPLTNSLINGFTWPAGRTLWVDYEVQDDLETAGLTYVKSQAGTPVVYHGITTNTTLVEDQEISVVAAEDEMRRSLRTALDGFRGRDRKITQSRLDALALRVQQVLGNLVKNAIIQEFGTITVLQDNDLPTLVWIRFGYIPIYPMNEIIFEYGFLSAPLSA